MLGSPVAPLATRVITRDPTVWFKQGNPKRNRRDCERATTAEPRINKLGNQEVVSELGVPSEPQIYVAVAGLMISTVANSRQHMHIPGAKSQDDVQDKLSW